jgi:uncharacterized protein involved in exopolysaccharide biosynthesis
VIVVDRGAAPVVPDGQVILFEQYRLIRRTWKWVLLTAVLVTIGVGAYVFLAVPVEYMATVRALPPNKSGTPLDNLVGGISSTLKDFGLSKLVGKGSSDNGYSKSVLITSQPLYDSLINKYDLYKVYNIPKGRYDKAYKKVADNVIVEISPEGPISVNVYDTDPVRAAKMANDVIYYTNVLARDINRRESEPLTKYVGERYEQARADQERLGIELQKVMAKTKIFDPESQGEVVGSALMEAEADVAAKRSLVELYRQSVGEDDPRTIQAKTMLQQAEDVSKRLAAGHAGALQGLSVDKLPASTVEYLHIRQDYEVNAKVLALLEPMYEQTKYEEVRDIPILNVLDEARVPPEKARPKRSVIVASAFLGTILISYVVIAFMSYWRSFRQRYTRYSMIQETRAITNGDARAGDHAS